MDAPAYPEKNDPLTTNDPPNAPKQNRNRVIHTCLPCHRAKRKCNRKKPCSQCLKRQVTGSCVYEAIAPEDLRTLQADDTSLLAENNTLRSRVAGLEAAVAEYKEQQQRARENGTRKRQWTSTEINTTSGGDKDGDYYGRSYCLGGAAALDFLRCMMSLVPNDQSDMLFAFSGSSTTQQSPALPGSHMFPTLFPTNYGVKEMLDVLERLGKETTDGLFGYIPRSGRSSTSLRAGPVVITAIRAVLGYG